VPNLPAKAFHFVDVANWPAVQQQGLCSTDELLRRGAFGPEVEAAVRAHRPEGVTLPDGRYIRDQRPMPPGALARCLDPGLVPADWYALINGCVFFWLDPERVPRHRAAPRGRRAGRDAPCHGHRNDRSCVRAGRKKGGGGGARGRNRTGTPFGGGF
jgi:hypothetical protein